MIRTVISIHFQQITQKIQIWVAPPEELQSLKALEMKKKMCQVSFFCLSSHFLLLKSSCNLNLLEYYPSSNVQKYTSLINVHYTRYFTFYFLHPAWGKHPLNSTEIGQFRFCQNITHYKSKPSFSQKIFITLRSRVQIPVSLQSLSTQVERLF